MGLFYKYAAGQIDELDPTSDNTGLNKKHQFESDIFYPSRLLLNGLPLKVMFQRHKSNFTLLSAPENPALHFEHFQHFKVSFQEVISSLHKVQLCPHKFHSIQQRLEKNTSPIYSQPCWNQGALSCSRSFITELRKLYTWPNTKQSFCNNDQKCCFQWIIYQKSGLFKA